MTEDGPVPTPPATIAAALIAAVSLTNPGYTANLPGTLVEDLTSTCAGAIQLIDQLRVELLNSITPFGANAFLLNQLGQLTGVEIGAPSNTSVFVTFTGTVGFPIQPGFLVGDGTHQYAVQDGTIVPTGGTTGLVQCVATVAGSWAIPINSVINLVTSVPSGVSLTVTNLNPGTPGTGAQTEQSYRADVAASTLVACQGSPNFLKTLLRNVTGVQTRLVNVLQVANGWEVIVGGSGDPYAIGNAILEGMADISVLQGSQISSTRNVSVNINQYPDVYTVVYVAPPQQTVSMTILWNTTGIGTNFVGGAQVAALAIPAIVSYINNIPTGAPLNLNDLQNTFIQAVASVLPSVLLTRFVVSVEINSSPVSPISGTQLIEGDPESFFETNSGLISVTQG